MACLLVITAIRPAPASPQNTSYTKILFLSSWSRGMPWQRAIETGLDRKIMEKKLPVRLYIEYVDGGRFPLAETKDSFYQLLKAKYSHLRLDMVISEGFPAAIMMQKASDLFPEAAKLVVQSPRKSEFEAHINHSRIILHQDFSRAILAMIDAYSPERIVVVVDVTDTHGKKRMAEFKQGLKNIGNTLPVTYLTGPTLDDIIHSTANLAPKTAIFYLLYFRDGKGNRLTPYQAVQKIALTASAPIFTHWDTLMGSGVVGGYLLSGEKVGSGIADVLAAFIKNNSWIGKSETDLEGMNFFEYQYDWRQLQHWHIPREKLPKQAHVLFDTPGLFETYPNEMTVLLSLIGVLILLLSALVFETLRRKKISEQLRENQEHLNAIFKAIPDPVIVFDAKGTVLYLNPEFERQLGWSESDLKGWQFPFVIEKYRDDIKAMIQEAVSHRDSVKIQVEGKSKTGHQMYMIASAATIYGINNQSAGVVVNLTDISKQKTLEDQLRQVQKMEAIGNLAGGVAHDYNNISTIIMGYTELALLKVHRDDPLFSDLLEIQSAARRSTDITRQLLAFARRQTIEPKVIDLNDLLEGMLKMLRRLIGEDVELFWNPQPDLWSIKIDPSQIDQIIANLCVNARDAIADVGKVTIETGNITFDNEYRTDHADYRPGDFVSIVVSDDGDGITPENMDKIFDPFFSTKALGKGTGLGLATVYGIVKQNNGFINVYSEPGHGTTFKIYLPRHKGQVEDIRHESKSEVPLGHGETVMLVEDEHPILKLGTRMLQNLGYSVLAAATPSEAIKVARTEADRIKLLITDVVMPEMNGKDLSEQLTALNPKIRTLYMSGYTANVIVDRGILKQGVFFIPKPLSEKDLARKVRDVLS